MSPFSNRQKQSLVVLLIMIAGIYWTTRQSNAKDPQAQVKRITKRLVKAAEDKDLDPFEKHLSEQFEDAQGRPKAEVLKMLFGIFFQYKKLGLSTLSLDVQTGTNPNVIDVHLILLMTNSPLETDRGDFMLTYRREDERWRLWSAEWEDGANYAR